jgi:hypothetical protein
MYTSTLEKMLSKISPIELAILIDKETDLNSLIKLLPMKFNTSSSNKILHLVSILTAAYHKKLGDLESLLDSISYEDLEDLKDSYMFSESYIKNELEILINKRCKKLKKELETIDLKNKAIVSFRCVSSLFDQIKLHSKLVPFDEAILTLLSADKLILISPEDVTSNGCWSHNDGYEYVTYNDGKIKIDSLKQFIDVKNYPRITRNGGTVLFYELYIVKKDDGKLYWHLKLRAKTRYKENKILTEEKQRLAEELQNKFKFQDQEVDCIIGTEEEILEKLKKRFPKKEVK